MQKRNQLQKNRKVFFLIPLLFLITGCNQSRLHHFSSELSTHELEARHYDIPLFPNSRLMPECCSQHDTQGTFITYSVVADYAALLAYYSNEMERYGWRQLYTIQGLELLLGFEKPQKFATVSIRPFGAQFKVVIGIGFKGS